MGNHVENLGAAEKDPRGVATEEGLQTGPQVFNTQHGSKGGESRDDIPQIRIP